ncbi:hypothetical protein CC80DRAFT_18465 [Byssothecium circinans]|uniref:Uncharacterized protein n=1 Tax=Byssothecium circinans TaxID=147558 RepID=A0A6A5U453_9PLEO|nr:hypothetical protein CC80DRAFT_18465 [Byssothecium circinans]
MDTPIIRVEDWDAKPPVTIKYICGDNELELETVWAAVNGLSSHSGRGKVELVRVVGGCDVHLKECSQDFWDGFWDCMAKLLDYFADFFVQDNAAMQSMWFHLLDVLQEAAVLPHDFWDPGRPSCTHGERFAREYERTLCLINEIISPNGFRAAEPRVRPKKKLLEPSSVKLGGFKAGLKPWQQFMYSKAPGFDVPEEERIYNYLEGTDGPGQYLPMGALAIVERHTARARALTSKVAQRSSDGHSEVEMLSKFDQHSHKVDGKPFTYTSISGRKKTAQTLYPNPGFEKAPRRYLGLGDPSCIEPQPNLSLLDESVGFHRGFRDIEGYGHPDGTLKFHMMAVHSSSSVDRDTKSAVDRQKYSKLFDNWAIVEEKSK